MPAIAFLPWLGLRRRIRVAEIEIVPLREYLSSVKNEERNWLEKYFNCYRHRDGKRSVDTVCVVIGDDPGEIAIAVRALAVCSLIDEHAKAINCGNSDRIPPRAERWKLYLQDFDPAASYVTIAEGYTISLRSLPSGFVEVEPLSPGQKVKEIEDYVLRMAEELMCETKKDPRLAIALDLLREGALTRNFHLRHLNLILIGSALELLAGVESKSGKAKAIGESLDCAVLRCQKGPLGVADRERREFLGILSAGEVDPELVRLWVKGCDDCTQEVPCPRHHPEPFRGFYQLRNDVVHEGRVKPEFLRHRRPDNGSYHRWEDETGKGVHVADVALVMSGWFLLDRVASRLPEQTWLMWSAELARTASHLGMATT